MSIDTKATNLTKAPIPPLRKKRSHKSKMSIKFYKPELEARFRQCVEENDSSNIALMNKLIETVFNLDNIFSEDAIQNVEELSDLLSTIDWESLREIKAQLQENPLTRNVTLKDVVHGMIIEGVKSYRQKVDAA